VLVVSILLLKSTKTNQFFAGKLTDRGSLNDIFWGNAPKFSVRGLRCCKQTV